MSPVPVQMWQWEPSPGADVAGGARSRCRCGSGEPSPGADVAGGSPLPVQMWHREAVCARGHRCFAYMIRPQIEQRRNKILRLADIVVPHRVLGACEPATCNMYRCGSAELAWRARACRRHRGLVRVAVTARPGAEVAGAGPSPGADVARVSPVSVQMWRRWGKALRRRLQVSFGDGMRAGHRAARRWPMTPTCTVQRVATKHTVLRRSTAACVWTQRGAP